MVHITTGPGWTVSIARLECDICQKRSGFWVAARSPEALFRAAGRELRTQGLAFGWWTIATAAAGELAHADLCPKCRGESKTSSTVRSKYREPPEN